MGQSSYPGSKEWTEHNHHGINLFGHGDVKAWGACINASLSYEASKGKMHASMHAHVSKGQGLGSCDLGLRPPPPMCKVKQEGPPKLQNVAALLSPPFWSPTPLSLAIRWQGHMKGKVHKPLRPRFLATNGPRPPPKI